MTLFFRIHWNDCPRFSRTSASSAPWGEDCERVRGYSAFDDASRLADYFAVRGGVNPNSARLIVFEGVIVGTGPDYEDLVVPTRGGKRFYCDPAVLAEMTECDSEEEIIKLARQYRVPARGRK